MLRCWTTNVREQWTSNGFLESNTSMRRRALEEFNNQVKNPSVTIIPVSVIEEWQEDVLELTVYYNAT
ncbi:MAG: hypothetical protein DBY43_07400 [Clostridiaceae bacterium]|nr:MAG: hypothetical protein DBY43_07400 [Clostridiaceae bacterium]